jgi:ribonuclease Y
MAVATDQNIIAAVAFSSGGIVAYAVAKWRETTLNEMHERRLRTEVEIARRETAAEASGLKALAESESTEARRLVEEARKEINEAVQAKAKAAAEQLRARQETLRLANLPIEELRKAAIEAMRSDCVTEARHLHDSILSEAEDQVAGEARRRLIAAMQRLAPAVTQQSTAVSVSIPSEEMKGRLIGRDGRNIRTFEQSTGTSLLIDETPDAVLISCFDPVRREIARIALQAVVSDGRVSPALIEEYVATARTRVIDSARQLGRAAVRDLGLPPLEPIVEELLGKLHFRLSSNQNTLDHSVEVARLCSMIASELGLDPLPAKRAGLLHDLGKAIEAEAESSHALAGASLLQRLGEDPRVVNAVAAHHREVEPESVYAPLVMIADTISGSRPGARSSSIEGLIRRQRGLEEIALGFTGVSEAFAVQAGRELRVIVQPEQIDDATAGDLARRIRIQVEQTLSFPGTVRIVVIRERRFMDEAR